MANHCIDCEFCGADMRSISNCCEKQKQKEISDEKKKREKEKETQDFHAKYGISIFFSFEDLIRKLEKLNDPLLLNHSKEVAAVKRNEEEKIKNCKHVWENMFMFSSCKKCGITDW